MLSLVSLFLLFFLVPDAVAQKEQEPMSSFEKRVAIFEKFFASKPLLLKKQKFTFQNASPTGLIFFYHRFEDFKMSYDITKGDSLRSRFIGYISVNYIDVVSKKCGDVDLDTPNGKVFSTIEAARYNRNNEYCYEKDRERTVKFVFAYQNGRWVFKLVLNAYSNEPDLCLSPVFAGISIGDRYYVEDNKFWEALIQ